MQRIKRDLIRSILLKKYMCIDKISQLGYFGIYHNHDWDGGYDSKNGYNGSEKEFYDDMNSMLNFILDYIGDNKISSCIVLPPNDCTIFESWFNIGEIPIYQKLNRLLNAFHINDVNKDGLIIDIYKDWNILKNIIEGGFMYISCLYIYFPEINIIVQPAHHMEFYFYDKDFSQYKNVKHCIETSYPMLIIYDSKEYL